MHEDISNEILNMPEDEEEYLGNTLSLNGTTYASLNSAALASSTNMLDEVNKKVEEMQDYISHLEEQVRDMAEMLQRDEYIE